MFHNFTLAAAFYDDDIKPLRAQSTTLQVDDLVGPFTGPEVTALGVPYVAGGIVQVGSAIAAVGEAMLLAGLVGYGHPLKQAMKAGMLHARTAGSQLIHQDLPQAANRVDLDPGCVTTSGIPPPGSPTARTSTRRPPPCCSARGCWRCTSSRPDRGQPPIVPYPILSDGITYTAHLAGTARMGTDPETSVCAPDGRLHEVDKRLRRGRLDVPDLPRLQPDPDHHGQRAADRPRDAAREETLMCASCPPTLTRRGLVTGLGAG